MTEHRRTRTIGDSRAESYDFSSIYPWRRQEAKPGTIAVPNPNQVAFLGNTIVGRETFGHQLQRKLSEINLKHADPEQKLTKPDFDALYCLNMAVEAFTKRFA